MHTSSVILTMDTLLFTHLLLASPPDELDRLKLHTEQDQCIHAYARNILEGNSHNVVEDILKNVGTFLDADGDILAALDSYTDRIISEDLSKALILAIASLQLF